MEKQVDLTANQPPRRPSPHPPSRNESLAAATVLILCSFPLFFFARHIKLLGRPLTEPLVFLYNCSRRRKIHNSSIKMPYPPRTHPHTPPQPPSASRGASDLQSIIHDPTSSNHYCEERDPVVPNSPPAGKQAFD